MTTWSRKDVAGVVFSLLGIVLVIFSEAYVLAALSLLTASVCLLYSLYESKFGEARYHDILCHYQAVLTTTNDCWIAWNKNLNYVNASKKFKELFNVQGLSIITFSNVLESISESDAGALSENFFQLQKIGQPFVVQVHAKDGLDLKISGSKTVIDGLETITLWARNITEVANFVRGIEQDLIDEKSQVDSLKEILDTLPIQVWKRNNKLNIVYCNKSYADALDINAERVVLDNIPLVPGSLFGQGHSLAETVKKSGKSQSVVQGTVIGGTRRKLLVSECPTINSEFIGYAQDVTEQENLSANFDKVITANCDILENISTAIAVFREDMRLSFFNSAYYKLFKLDEAWLHSHPTYGEILEERRNNRQLTEHADFQAFKKQQLSLFTSITSQMQELSHLPNGRVLRVLTAPYPLGGLLFMYEDVTDSLALQRQNNTLLAVQKETLDHLYEGIMVCGSDNRVKIVNDALLKVWGLNNCSVADFKEVHISEMLDDIKDCLDYGENWKAFRENAVSNLTDRINKTGRLIKKDGSVILFNYTPLPDGAHMHSFIDITDTCVVEKAIMEKNQALRSAQNLRLEFVSSISTELKEPLNSLIGFAELLIRKYFGDLNTKQLEYCTYILNASNQLNELINNLLDMVSIDVDSVKLNKTQFSIQEVLEDVISGIKKRAQEKSVDIVRNFPTESITYLGDKIRLKQAFFNILINAIQFTSLHGTINIKIANENSEIKVIIKNEGIVYKNKEDGKVFKRTYSKFVNFLNNDANSISMPLVKTLIEMHGGTLNIHSDPDSGTSVVCIFPVVTDSNQNENTPEEELPFEEDKKVVNFGNA